MADSEKITINLSVVDLGQVDLLVEQGFYSSRSDLIRAAIRSQLDAHAEVVAAGNGAQADLVVGVLLYDRNGLEARRTSGEKLEANVSACCTSPTT